MSVEKEDKIIFCRDCGEEFIFSAREQEFYAQKGFENDPVRCSTCRSVRKRTGGVTNMSNSNSGNSFGRSGYDNGGGNSYGNGNGGAPRGNFGNGGGGYSNQRGGYSNGGGNSYGNGGGGNSYGNQRSGGSGYNNGGGYGNGGGGNSYGNGGGGNSYGNSGYSNAGNFGQMERQRYPITCANCGIKTEVPFVPRDGVPVFCRTCYNSQKPNRN